MVGHDKERKVEGGRKVKREVGGWEAKSECE